MAPSTSSVLAHSSFQTSVLTDPIKALHDPRSKQAMDEEITTLNRNHSWDFVDLPLDKKVIGCQWVYTVKLKADVT